MTLMVFCYTLEVCLVIWKQYKLVCENLTNMFLLYHICIHLQEHLHIYCLIEIKILWCFHSIVILIGIYPWNIIIIIFLLVIVFLNVNSKIFHNDDWTPFMRLLNYSLKIVYECRIWTWMSFIHTYNIYWFLCINIKTCYYIFWTITSYYIEGI
jgi:hypothetical protein